MTEYFEGQHVSTPYGPAIYLSTHSSTNHATILKLTPVAWKLANDQLPVFYLNSNDVHSLFHVGGKCHSAYGEGEIKAFRKFDRMYSVELVNWKLANGKSPILYGQEAALISPRVTRLHPAPITESTQKNQIEASLENALKFKEEAGELFRAKEYDAAKEKYLETLRSMEYMAEEYSNS